MTQGVGQAGKSRRLGIHELLLCLSGDQLQLAGREFSPPLPVFTSREVRIVAFIELTPCIVMGEGGSWGMGWDSNGNKTVFLPTLTLYPRRKKRTSCGDKGGGGAGVRVWGQALA